MMNVYQSQAKTKSFNNTDMPAKGVFKRRVDHLLSNTFFCKESSIIIHLMLYIYSKIHFVYKHITKWIQIGMRICIMHFASSLLRIVVAKKKFLQFFYGILLVVSRCCFHHLVENSILYKKDIQHFYIGPTLFFRK